MVNFGSDLFRPLSHPIRGGLFWLFWGAKKGGTFLGSTQKKYSSTSIAHSVSRSLLDSPVFQTSVWRLVYVELMMPKRELWDLHSQAGSL